MRYFYIFVIFALGLTACQTNQLKQFEKLKVGMDKGEVLDVMGSPQRTLRWKGMDRWSYDFWQDDKLYNKEVHFNESISQYVGEAYKPEISAEQQDAANATANKELAEQELARWQEQRKNYNDYEDSVRGDKEIRYVPTFTPVQ